MILSGSADATLLEVRLVDIHGTRFYDLIYAHADEPQQARRARVGVEDVYAEPQAGDAVSVSYLMNVPTAVARRAG